MIDHTVYTREWIDTLARKYPKTDKILIEKAVRALSLLDGLQATGLDFIFKGGTALMLMLKDPRRLSIDIDVLIPDKPRDLNTYFDQIIQQGTFHRYQEDERMANSAIDKAHYKFFYTPAYHTHSREEYILLDVLFAANQYPALTKIPISSPLLKLSEDPQFVRTPSIAHILGDKLTAFAPNTSGIPYYKGKTSMSMEIMKQLFDIASLFDKLETPGEVGQTFSRIAALELKHRSLPHLSATDVLDDIFQTALCLSLRGKAGNCRFPDLQEGINRVKHCIIGERFTIDTAILAAAKTAYITQMIRNGQNFIERYKANQDLTSCTIQSKSYSKLNKLKKNNREAFWYWYHALKLPLD